MEVTMVDEEMITAASDVLRDYYGVNVSNTFLKCVLEENPDLAQEVKDGGVRDTCQREILVDAVLRKIGVRSWPIYGKGNAVAEEFFKVAQDALSKVGGRFV
jgi:hypothetical protein